MVRMAGIEPAASAFPTQHSTPELHPDYSIFTHPPLMIFGDQAVVLALLRHVQTAVQVRDFFLSSVELFALQTDRAILDQLDPKDKEGLARCSDIASSSGLMLVDRRRNHLPLRGKLIPLGLVIRPSIGGDMRNRTADLPVRGARFTC